MGRRLDGSGSLRGKDRTSGRIRPRRPLSVGAVAAANTRFVGTSGSSRHLCAMHTWSRREPMTLILSDASTCPAFVLMEAKMPSTSSADCKKATNWKILLLAHLTSHLRNYRWSQRSRLCAYRWLDDGAWLKLFGYGAKVRKDRTNDHKMLLAKCVSQQ